MKMQPIFVFAWRQAQRPMQLISLMTLCFVLSAGYPSDLKSYPVLPANTPVPALVTVSEHYLRYIPTFVQVGLPLLLRDKVGLVQLLYVAISTTIATHAAKRFLNDRYVMATRLGQRPSRNGSKHNMPSGHSSMASCAVYFVGKRYSIWLGFVLALFLLLTMYARVILNDHTESAVVAGALLGFLLAAVFTSKRIDASPITTQLKFSIRKFGFGHARKT